MGGTPAGSAGKGLQTEPPRAKMQVEGRKARCPVACLLECLAMSDLLLAVASLGYLLVLASSARAEGLVEITALARKAGTPVGVRVVATGDPVYLPACRGVVWEAFDTESQTFGPISAQPCGPTANAVKIDKDGTELRLDADPKGAQAVRPVLLVALGCVPDKPYPLAGCSRADLAGMVVCRSEVVMTPSPLGRSRNKRCPPAG